MKESIRAEKEGYDAIVIYCFSDVGIDAIRENVRIPVIGPGETSLAAASMICNRFTVLTSESINIPRTYRRLMRNGIAREKWQQSGRWIFRSENCAPIRRLQKNI